MATYAYDDFRVSFSPRDDGSYDVHAIDAEGTAAAGAFTVPLSADALEATVVHLSRSRRPGATRWASARVPAARPPTDATIAPATRDVGADGPPALDPEELGATLADALLGGDIGAAYGRACRRAEERRRGIRLSLSLASAPALLSVPWEFLYRRPRFLASQRHTPLVRVLDTGPLAPPPAIDAAVRVLGVIASPVDLSPLDVAAERARVEQAVATVAGMGRVQLDWLEPATPRGLRQALRDGSYHILHFVGHSDFTADGEGMIYLERGDDRHAEPVDSTLLANLLADQSLLRLVVLNSCEGARTTLTDPYAGVATTLVQLGVPAVIAMQFEISDRAAVLFAEELYTNLIGRQHPIDAAVAEARKAIYTEVDKTEFATPVLFVRDPDVELFRFEVAEAPLPPPPPPGLASPRRYRRPVLIAIAAAVAALVIAAAVLWWPDGDRDGTVAPSTTVAGRVERIDFPSLRVGSDGPAVLAAQHLLNERGHPVGADGFFGDNTVAALRAFEASVGIPPDAILGPLTWSELVAGQSVRVGNTGDAVRAAQVLLVDNGYDLAVDGRFGDATRAAVIDFEQRHGLPVDGIVDIETWKLLVAGPFD